MRWVETAAGPWQVRSAASLKIFLLFFFFQTGKNALSNPEKKGSSSFLT